MAREAKRIVVTGIPSLDLLLGGGLPARQAIVVTGVPGTGKTILCSQIAFAQAAQGTSVVLATLASEPHDKLLDALSGFSFFDADRIGNEIFVLSAYPWVKKGAKEAKELLLNSMDERHAKMLFVDGLRSLRDLWQDEAMLREFLYELNVGIAQRGAIGLFSTEYPARTLIEHPEATTVDGIVALSAQRFGGRLLRRAEVVKLRGRRHLTGEHLMHITDHGITIVPRLEEATSPEEQFTPSTTRATFGLKELDHILRGGLPTKSTTLMAGSTGVGKTLLSLWFCAAGARQGETALLLTYSEPPERLIARAKAVGLDVEDLVESGKLVISYRSPVHLEGDDLIADLLSSVDRCNAKRVVVDGIGDIEARVLEPSRVRNLLGALIIQLRNRGITALFIKEVAKLAGQELDFSDTPLAATAENMLFLRQIELRGRLHRILSVLKMRESAYDAYLREFEIASDGIRVLEPLESAAGLLTGAARPIVTMGSAP